jgi:HAD superfamily hydrolase (TIGR01509 family)
MIKAVVFDYHGMVFIEPCYFNEIAKKKFGINIEDWDKFYNREYQEAKRGKSDVLQVLPKYFKNWNLNIDLKEFMHAWYNNGKFNKPLLDLIRELKDKKIMCILATNNERSLVEYQKEICLYKYFDFFIASYETGYCKPEKEFFNILIKKANLKPEEILFCDDKEENLIKAKAFGFKVHLYKNIGEFRRTLLELNAL